MVLLIHALLGKHIRKVRLYLFRPNVYVPNRIVILVVHSSAFCLCLLKVELINLVVSVFRQRLTWISGRVASISITQ